LSPNPAFGRRPLFTIGHSTRSIEELLEILRSFEITLLVDVRTVPKSRHNPQFNRETLPASLEAAGIAYRHEPALGGLRKPRPDSRNTAWQNASFRGYADHMESAEFETALRALLETVESERVVVMCAESVPWRCHRSLISDAVVARGVEVRHLMGVGKADAHRLTPFARVEDSRVTYPGLL
jgi:uncharacterized protein (DUF488 family)